MRRPVWLALACVAGLSLYVMNAEDDEGLLAPDRPAASERAPARASARDAAVGQVAGGGGGRGTSRGVARGASASAKAAADAKLSQSLVRHVQAWQLRGSNEVSSPALAQALAQTEAKAPSASPWAAWSAMAPPPPPEPPPQAALEELVPAEPVAPPFPHEWVGRFNDLTDTKVLERAVLAGTRKTMVVQPGDVIEGQWRIDGIQERRMTVTYLPLNQPQDVAMK